MESLPIRTSHSRLLCIMGLTPEPGLHPQLCRSCPETSASFFEDYSRW